MADIDALIEDKLAELERLQRKPASAELRNGLTGMAFEVLDSVRYRLQEFAQLRGRSALPDTEVAVVVALAREMIVLAVERERADEAARARALAERHTVPAAPAGSFSSPRAAVVPPAPAARSTRLPPAPAPRGRAVPPPLPGRAAPTVPVDPDERVTAPAPPLPRRPYRGQPHAPGEPDPGGPFRDDEPTPSGLLPEPGPAPRRPKGGRRGGAT